jgi:hypothetical protein
VRFLALALFLAGAVSVRAQQPAIDPQSDEDLTIQAFLAAVETAISGADHASWLALLSPNADRNAATEFLDMVVPPDVTRAVVRERDRSDLLGALPGDGYRLLVEMFIESGARGRILTCQLDIRRPRDSTDAQPWRLISQERLSFVEGLHRLRLNRDKQFAARDLVISAIDLELRLPSGDVFIAESDEGVTTLVLVGDGSMVFTPGPAEERGQLKIFAGSEVLNAPFTAAFVRVNPYAFEEQLKSLSLTQVAPDARALRRAQLVFDEDIDRSFSLDLSDLSRDTWSLLPQAGDFLAEVRTRRFGNLTYARSAGEAEDVTVFHRERKKNIAAYASPMKLSSRGRFYNEDDLTEYDILHYDIDAAFTPERTWLDGRVRVRLRVKAYALAALTFKLNEQLNVRSIHSDQLGRLLFLRVRNQNAVVVNLPSTIARDVELTLTVIYSGPIQSQGVDQESLAVQESRVPQEDLPFMPPEPNWLFSNRSYWYPQASVSDYATSTVRISVPDAYAAVAGGTPAPGGPTVTAGVGTAGRQTYRFVAEQPTRYLGLVVSRLNPVDSSLLTVDTAQSAASDPEETFTYLGGGVLARAKPPADAVPAVGTRNAMMLSVTANRRQMNKGRDTMGVASDILRFYSSIVGDVPYDAMTIAMVESQLPGGHSPAYMVMLNNPAPLSPYSWRNDPAAFSNYPEFYLAHEIAHQWWGQAVGWQNYHEQWLSEGISQYFAALFARDRRGETAFRDVIRQFRRWALSHSDQGPIYLGYRLGHLKNDSRVFRAIIYNKSAAVLHMLRRLMGDEAFFNGLRRYYTDNRYKKAGTADLQRAMEAEFGASLERFFQRWIFEAGIPRLRYSTAVENQELIVRFEQIGITDESSLFDLPVTVSINYADGAVEEIVAVHAASVEKRFPLKGAVRNVEVNADEAALAVFERR